MPLKKNWTACRESLPDSDTTVMIFTPGDAETVWMGYHDGEVWRSVEAAEVHVTHWAPLIDPPEPVITFGKHKGKRYSRIPAEWLLWWWESGGEKETSNLHDYVFENFDKLKRATAPRYKHLIKPAHNHKLPKPKKHSV